MVPFYFLSFLSYLVRKTYTIFVYCFRRKCTSPEATETRIDESAVIQQHNDSSESPKTTVSLDESAVFPLPQRTSNESSESPDTTKSAVI